MRACCWLVLCALFAPALARADGVTLLPATAAWRWKIATAPKLAPQIGAQVASGLDAVAGRTPAALDPLGMAAPRPPRWPFASDGDLRSVPAARDERIAVAFGSTTFSLEPAHAALEMLELRVRYEDGIAIWLNGIEVVRQALESGGTNRLAARPHGPEWETFHVQVVPGLLRLGDNTLAIEVHPSGRRAGPTVVAEVVGRKDRGLQRGPVVAKLTATSATILVETDPGVGATLTWGTSADRLDRTLASPPQSRHRFELANLPPGATVHYRIVAGASQTPRYAIHAVPKPGARIRLGIYGDVRGGHRIHRQLVEQILGEGVDAVAVTGDMVLHGADQADWQKFFAVTGELLAQVPYFPAIGNHDLGHRDETLPLPPAPPDRPPGAYWYSTDFADLHLVFLDSSSYDLREQEKWLAADLAAARARKVRAILVFTHDGPYARGYHGGNALARARYLPILKQHRVDFIFAGHDHLFQRGETQGIRYVVTGGGGAPLYGIRCGVTGRPKCRVDDGMAAIAKEHHYNVLTIGRDLELCTRRVDGSLLEPCTRYSFK